MRLFIFTTIILFLSLESLTQNFVFVGDKRFEATTNWVFLFDETNSNSTNIGMYKQLEVCVGKYDNVASVFFSINEGENSYVGSDLTLFLSNGSAIILTNKISQDYVNNKSISQYSLSTLDLDSLKKYTIQQIRLTRQCTKEYPRSAMCDKSYIYENKKQILMLIGQPKQKTYYETEIELQNLFK